MRSIGEVTRLGTEVIGGSNPVGSTKVSEVGSRWFFDVLGKHFDFLKQVMSEQSDISDKMI